MYVKDTEHGYVIVCLYVDDMLIVGSDNKMITSIKNMLNSRLDMKDLGIVDVILGIKSKEHQMHSFKVNHTMLTIFLESLTKIILV